MTTKEDTHELPQLAEPLPDDLNVAEVARDWLSRFASLIQAGETARVVNLLVDDSFWRDVLAITWDFRTFRGHVGIKKLLDDRLHIANLSTFDLKDATLVNLSSDIAWIQGIFTFEVGDFGLGSGVFRLIPAPDGQWKAYTVYTGLTGLKDYPDTLRNPLPNHGKWLEDREREVEFADSEPYVVVVGGGHGGLIMAARLKHLGIPTLVLERNAQVGDTWRGRYETLCLHDSVWYNDTPYLPFPSTWPRYTPGHKFGDWLQFYAQTLELNVWTSALAEKIARGEGGQWDVTVRRGGPDGSVRILHPTHVVVAPGLFGKPHVPHFEGKESFKGNIFHASDYTTARNNVGKRVVVIGAGTSAHDIAADHAENGVGEVTMYQRNPTHVITEKNGMSFLTGLYYEGGPPTAIPDLVMASFPRLVTRAMMKRVTRIVGELDKELLDGLTAKGFRHFPGEYDAGIYWSFLTNKGAKYIDVGASEMIADGRIKIKSGSELERFTENGLLFKDGSELEADVVYLATGFASALDTVRDLCEPEIAAKIKPVWGVDDECEMNSVWRDCGVENLWITFGSIYVARVQSIPLALQIKAAKEGIFKGERYSRG